MPSESLPPVVAIVVTCNPGPWFEETLNALREQDYANLAVLIVDAASLEDPLPRIAQRLPNAYVRRLSKNPGYSAATNRAMRIIRGASHLVLCHDDVAPQRDAISKMMREALRTNAGIVTPKMVDWNDPRILLGLGGTVDTTGSFVSTVEKHDMDQGQHDDTGAVFAGDGGFLLVKGELFTSLGGFDAAMTLYGEDVDFSWRAQVAGARVAAAPDARVRHLEAASKGMRVIGPTSDPDDDDSESDDHANYDELFLRRRHQLRTVLKANSAARLPFVMIRQAVFNVFEVVYATITGRPHHVSAIAAAWSWNFLHWRGLLSLRHRTQRLRKVRDGELRSRFASTRVRLAAMARQEWADRSERLARDNVSRELASLRKFPVAVWATIALIWLIGSRDLFSGGLPGVGQFAPLQEGPDEAIARYLGVWPGQGFGAPVLQSMSHIVVALLSVFFLGAVGVMHKVLVLGMLPLGVWGASRLTRPLKSGRARLMVIVAYAAVPLPYDSLAYGRWDGLICYAAAPWIIGWLLRSYGAAPYFARRGALQLTFRRQTVTDDEDLGTLDVSDHGPATADVAGAAALFGARAAEQVGAVSMAATTERRGPERRASQRRDRAWFIIVRRVIPLTLLLGVTALFAPQILFVAVFAALAILLAEKIAGHEPTERSGDSKRGLTIVAMATAVAAVLVLPGVIGSSGGLGNLWQALPSMNRPDGFGTLLRFGNGGFLPSMLTFGLLLAALPGILIGKAWRWRLSLRLWLVTLVLVTLTWVGAQGWLGPFVPDPHVYLPFAAAAVALNAGVGMISVQTDLRGYRFGWRQLVPLVAVGGVGLALLPIASRIGDGSWHLPETSNTSLLSWMPEKRAQGSFRTLWLGQGELMPGGPRRVDDGLAAAVAVDAPTPRMPDAADSGGAGEDGLIRAVQTARAGNTVNLGQLMAPYGVRYVVVPLRSGPTETGGLAMAPGPEVTSMLADQLDLRTVDSDNAILVYENTAWGPIREAFSDEADASGQGRVPSANLSGNPPALQRQETPARWSGEVAPGRTFVAESNSADWELEVGGVDAARQPLFGWANSFTSAGGPARLIYDPPTYIRVVQLAVAGLWLLIVLIALHYRARRGRYA